MYSKDTLNNFSRSIKSALYVYDRGAGSLFCYNGSEEKTSSPPQWMATMAENGTVCKPFQKDGKNYICYCFATDNDRFIIFQDDYNGEKLGIFVKLLTNFKESAVSSENDIQDTPAIKKELLKIKSEYSRLLMESNKKNSIIAELKNKLAALSNSDTENMRRTIIELTEVNASQNAQIRRMKADTDHTNFLKLKQVNSELRKEITAAAYKAAEAEERLNKTRKLMQSTIAELTRLSEFAKLESSDVRGLLSKISAAELGESGPSLTGAKSELHFQQGSSPEKARPVDITDIVNTLNAYIAKNDASEIDVNKLAAVVSISDKDGIKRNPAMALKPIIGALIGMSKASKLSPLQITTLCDALKIRQS